jgi:hypothetical protein
VPRAGRQGPVRLRREARRRERSDARPGRRAATSSRNAAALNSSG